MQRALDDADFLAFQLLRPGDGFLGQKMSCAVIDEIGGDELLGGELRLQIGASLARHHLAHMVGIAEQEGQIEDLQFRHPAGKRGNGGKARLNRSQPDIFRHFLFTAKGTALDDVETETAGQLRLHQFADLHPDFRLRLVIGKQRGNGDAAGSGIRRAHEGRSGERCGADGGEFEEIAAIDNSHE